MSIASSARNAATTATQPSAATLMLAPLKGRGTVWAIEHRFSAQTSAEFDDGWGTLDQAALEERQAPGTQVIDMHALEVGHPADGGDAVTAGRVSHSLEALVGGR